MKKILLAIIMLCALQGMAQQFPVGETLYLRFHENKKYEIKDIDYYNKSEDNYEFIYGIVSHRLNFYTVNKSNAKVIPLSELSNYTVKTAIELSNELKPFTFRERFKYFDALKKIFIVEVNELNQTATLIEAYIDDAYD